MVITDIAVDAFFRAQFEQVILDKVVVRNTELHQELAENLLRCSNDINDFPTIIGHTMCTYDFYEGMKHLYTKIVACTGYKANVYFVM